MRVSSASRHVTGGDRARHCLFEDVFVCCRWLGCCRRTPSLGWSISLVRSGSAPVHVALVRHDCSQPHSLTNLCVEALCTGGPGPFAAQVPPDEHAASDAHCLCCMWCVLLTHARLCSRCVNPLACQSYSQSLTVRRSVVRVPRCSVDVCPFCDLQPRRHRQASLVCLMLAISMRSMALLDVVRFAWRCTSYSTTSSTLPSYCCSCSLLRHATRMLVEAQMTSRPSSTLAWV